MAKPTDLKPSYDRYFVPADFEQLDNDIREAPRQPPSVGIFDAPFRCYKVNIEWDAHIAGAIGALTEWRTWTGDDDERNVGVQSIMEYLTQDFNCGGDDMPFELRQNPSNPCQLQQSLDGGEFWTTVFDFSLCQIDVTINEAGDVYDFSENGITTLTEYVNNYTTVNNFTPALVYDMSGADVFRDQALCYAIGLLYEAIKELHVQYFETLGGFAPLISIVATAVGALFTFITGGVGGIIVGALVAALAQAGVTYNASIVESDFNEHKDDIVCCMYENLKGTTPSHVGLQNSTSGCGLTGVALDIANEMQGYLDESDVFVTFLKLWEDGYRLAAKALLPECPCEALTTWTYDSDFPNFPEWDDESIFGADPATAVWAMTTGWSSVDIQDEDGGQYIRICGITVFFSTSVIVDEITLNYDLTKGTYNTSSNPAAGITCYTGGLDGTPVQQQFLQNGSLSNGTGKETTITPEAPVDTICVFVRSSNRNIASFNGFAKVNSVHIEGRGVKPLELT